MGVATGATGPNYGLNWNKTPADGGVATDNNVLAHVVERVSQVLLEEIFENGIVMASPERGQFNSSTLRITAPSTGYPLLGMVGGRLFRMTSAMEEDGTSDSGTTTTVVDTGLASSDEGFWVGAYIVWLTGANAGSVRQISAYNNSTKTLTWVTPLGSAVSAGETFTVTHFYVTGLTNGATNYIYIRESGASLLNQYGIVTFVATTSGTPVGTDLLIASAVLDGGGTCTSSDNSPTGADRRLYVGSGRGEIETVEYNYSGLLGGNYVDCTVPHNDFLFIGGRTLAVTGAGVTATMQEHYKPDECVVRLTNGSSYTRAGVLTVTIQGRRLLTL